MKKIFFLLSFALLAASCSVTSSSVNTSTPNAPVLTTTVASLDVSPTPITYVYTPSRYERKHATLNTILENAKYQALAQNGGDVLIQVSYKVEGKGVGKFIRKIKRLSITGYPAKFVDFRTPTAEDRENVEAFYKHGETTIKVNRRLK